MEERQLQAVVLVPREPAVVAGIPAVLRTAWLLASSGGVGAVLLYGSSEGFRLTWQKVIRRMPFREVSEGRLSEAVSSDSPVLVAGPDGMPIGDGLQRFVEEARSRKTPAVWTWRGRAVCVYEPEAARVITITKDLSGPAALLDRALGNTNALRVEAADESWLPLETTDDVAAAEEAFYARLGRAADSYLTRLERRFSGALSRRLARTPITPNQITATSLLVGLAGAACVASVSDTTCLLGTLLLCLSSVLDACDGEVARLKLLFSESGRLFDLAGDHLVNFSALAAIVWHVYRTQPDVDTAPLALLLAAGVAMSALSVWWLFLRKSDRVPDGIEGILRRLASRDFNYLLVPLAALRRLDWFVYGAAFGSHVFWIALVALAFRNSRRSPI